MGQGEGEVWSANEAFVRAQHMFDPHFSKFFLDMLTESTEMDTLGVMTGTRHFLKMDAMDANYEKWRAVLARHFRKPQHAQQLLRHAAAGSISKSFTILKASLCHPAGVWECNIQQRYGIHAGYCGAELAAIWSILWPLLQSS